MDSKLKQLIGAIIALIVGTFCGVGVHVATTPEGEIRTEIELVNTNSSLEYSSKNIPAQIAETILETVEGTIAVDDVPTVELVDGGPIAECPEESEECAKGAVLPLIDISSPESFYASVIDECVDFDGAWGSQCYDLMAYFHFAYTGQWLSTNGTGAAYGIWDARDYNNPINPETGETYYVYITDPTELVPGAFAIFYGGQYGHVGDVMGEYNNGYVSLLGTNQGGRACSGGGSAANVINISLANFRGAFLPRIWLRPEPTPEPEPEPEPVVDTCAVRDVYYGDTMGQIMLECTGEIRWGEEMNAYANSWVSTIVMPGQTVYQGWISPLGVGLFAGDTIKRIAD